MKIIDHKTVKIILSGEGGQGVQTIAKALTNVSAEEGYFSTYIPSFGVEQRGAPSVSYNIISKKEIKYPKFKNADIIVILSQRAIKSIEDYVTPNSDIIFDSSKISTKLFPKIAVHRYGIPATKLAVERFDKRSYNVIMFGVLTNILNFDTNISFKVLEEELRGKWDKNSKDKSKQAFLYGREAILENKEYSSPSYTSKTTPNVIRSRQKNAVINPKLCKGCGICIEKCPVGALKFGDDLGVFSTPVPELDIDKCIACGNCRRFCPDGAISVEKIK